MDSDRDEREPPKPRYALCLVFYFVSLSVYDTTTLALILFPVEDWPSVIDSSGTFNPIAFWYYLFVALFAGMIAVECVGGVRQLTFPLTSFVWAKRIAVLNVVFFLNFVAAELSIGVWPGSPFNSAAWMTIPKSLSLVAIAVLTRHLLVNWRIQNNLCGACGYSLRGLPAARCPECGWTPDASVVNCGK